MSAPKFTDFEITEAMVRDGGSFVEQLGRLWRMADAVNRATLKAAFPEYWVAYSDPAMHAAMQERAS